MSNCHILVAIAATERGKWDENREMVREMVRGPDRLF
jgi:hypothetical protein